MSDPDPEGATPEAPSAVSGGPASTPKAPPKLGSRTPVHELYPDEVVGPPSRGMSLGGGVAITLAILVVVLLVLMVTGYNNGIPYLHPASTAGATIVGDRDSLSYLQANGTTVTSTMSGLCPECPFTVGLGAQFTYDLNLTNDFKNRSEVGSISASSPFSVVSWGPIGTEVGGGLSQEYTIILQAPSQSGVYTVPLIIDSDVG